MIQPLFFNHQTENNMQIENKTFAFLEALKNHNDRIWFKENKPTYDDCLDNAKSVFTEIFKNLERHDQLEGQKIYRIYRDIRFSKDKTPYNPRFATDFRRLGNQRSCDYFLQVEPNNSFLIGGLWLPEKDRLLRIRKEIEIDDSEFRALLTDKNYRHYFGDKFEGEELKTSPKGFDKNHPAIDLLRKKSFLAIRKFTNEEVLSENFIDEVDQTFIALRPMFDLFSDILSTNLNGESI